ncbi:MAG: class I SAM-dependent methyltransferase, partial [Candidatus Curtissbacteria bacterium]
MQPPLSAKVSVPPPSHSFSNLLELYQLAGKKVLDIGSSEGEFLKHFGTRSVGVTIIPEHVEAARKNGLTVVLGNIEDPTFTLQDKFEAVWANNLFEHMNA